MSAVPRSPWSCSRDSVSSSGGSEDSSGSCTSEESRVWQSLPEALGVLSQPGLLIRRIATPECPVAVRKAPELLDERAVQLRRLEPALERSPQLLRRFRQQPAIRGNRFVLHLAGFG